MEVLDYLKKLEENGFTAYIVGGYVRDYILDVKTYDVDIATNAKPDEIRDVFNIQNKDNIGCINIKDDKYSIDITTFRKERSYFGHIPKKVKYIDDIKEDLKRRDFTMNTICMDSNSKMYDFLGGMGDLSNKTIRVVGNYKKKLYQDPIRIVRALRFMSLYDFKIEDNALFYIIENKKLIKEISKTKLKEEIEFILSSKNCTKSFKYMNNLNLLDVMGIRLDRNLVFVDDLCGMWAQLEYDNSFPFKKEEMIKITAIKGIISKGKIEKRDIYEYGLDVCLTSASILDIDKKSIKKLNTNMNIHKGENLCIDGNTITSLVECQTKNIIKDIKLDLIENLISGKLKNEKKELKEYIKKKWK